MTQKPEPEFQIMATGIGTIILGVTALMIVIISGGVGIAIGRRTSDNETQVRTPAQSPSTVANPQPLDCVKFVSDKTIDDGTVLQPGTTQTKTWVLNNCGTTTWSSANGYKVVALLGDGGQTKFRVLDVPQVAPGANGEISVEITVAPQPGSHQISFGLADQNDKVFGLEPNYAFYVQYTIR